MIKIDVPEPYCQDCLEFEAQVTDPVVVYGDNQVMVKTDTVISCQHSARCSRLKKYLEVALYGGPVPSE